MSPPSRPSPEELRACLATLVKARELPPDDPEFLALEQAAAFLRKSAKKRRSRQREKANKAADRERLRRTGLSVERLGAGVGIGAEGGATAEQATAARLHGTRRCYACREPFRDLHHHFDKLCQKCGDASLEARDLRVDLAGRRALVTGGRIKIGYATALRLLRDGAEVHVTSRFVRDAERRYAAEPDQADWRHRLHFHRADFRNLPALLALIETWRAGPPFDILINNAAQTVWRPPEYYTRLWAGEDRGAVDALAAPAPQAEALATLTSPLFPEGRRDGFGDPLDLRRTNSWVQALGEIDPVEFVESQVVNAMAPYLLCSELKPSLLRSRHPDRYIVNVAAVEGQFSRPDKSARHPHTNMAKAALNMLTATSASAFAEEGIYMVSVDPGWVSHEVPQADKDRARARGFHTPLEMEDAAARIYHPIAAGRGGTPLSGILLKDFQEVPW